MPRSAEVDALLDRLDHPRRSQIDLLRGTLLAAAPGIVEMVKWNSPTFGAPEPFATLHLREKIRVPSSCSRCSTCCSS